jgi:hypothetical protein
LAATAALASICRICGRVLFLSDRRRNSSGWQHALGDFQLIDEMLRMRSGARKQITISQRAKSGAEHGGFEFDSLHT